jgi:hypothetical protein
MCSRLHSRNRIDQLRVELSLQLSRIASESKELPNIAFEAVFSGLERRA